MLSITVLGSGSSGNCALVATPRTRLLIDCGLSARQILRRLDAAEVDPESLDGIVLTHEHGDHVRGLDVFCRRHDVPVISTPTTREALRYVLKEPKRWKLAAAGAAFEIGDIGAQMFAVPHDAVDPVGLVFRDGDSSIGIVSDVGFVTGSMIERLRGLDTLFIEANYDATMLQNDTKRPWSTKQRIAARHGHLSNDQTAELIAGAAAPGLRRVILGHLSEDCNDPAIAIEAARAAAEAAGASDADVLCALRHEAVGAFDAAWPKAASAVPAAAVREDPPSPPPAVAASAWAPVQAELF